MLVINTHEPLGRKRVSPNPMAYHNFQHQVTILRHIPFGRIMSYPNVWCKTFPNRKSASHLTWRTFDMLQMLSPSSVGQNGSNPTKTIMSSAARCCKPSIPVQTALTPTPAASSSGLRTPSLGNFCRGKYS